MRKDGLASEFKKKKKNKKKKEKEKEKKKKHKTAQLSACGGRKKKQTQTI